ncbi:MAG: hypothetical protein J0I93_12545 [Legionella sp.]|nr:hypothetical protein [Legionella sp.]
MKNLQRRFNKSPQVYAEAICEAVTRPTMRFVPIKTIEQQDIQVLHKVQSKIIKEELAQWQFFL